MSEALLTPLDLAFLLSGGVTIAMQLLFFAFAAALKIDKVTDLAGCTNFVVLAAGTLFLSFDLIDNRRIVLTSLVCASRLELAAFLVYRVLKRGKDSRFDAVRERCLVFLVFWVWQMLWVFVVSTPVIYVNAVTLAEVPPIGALDWVGWALVVVGCVLQTVADLHKNAFRSDPANNKKVCDRGLWKYSRHPNFFGEVLIWWGVFIAGIPVFVQSPAGFATVVSPVFTMFVLLGFTGIPQAEGKASARWYDGGESEAQYVEYFRSTPPLMMCPPALYRAMPLALKRLLCFEFPCYEYKAENSDEEAAYVADGALR